MSRSPPPALALGTHHAAKGAGGPPLLLLHGFIGAPSAWDAVLAALPRHGPVFCPWLPGHGPAPPTPPDWPSAVDSVVQALRPGAVLAGYSMGGRLALAAALATPGRARATVLIGAQVGLADAPERARRAQEDAERARALRRGDLAAFVDAWEAQPLFASQRSLPASRLAMQRTSRLAHEPTHLAWSFEVAGLACMPDLRHAVAAARLPLCFATGALDTRFAALAASLARPPWVTHRSVPGAGHNLLLEAPEAVAALILEAMETP